MLKPQIPIAKEGYPFIGYSLFLTLVLAILGYTVLTVIFVAITTFVLLFFRDPERFIPNEENVVLSPADGKIIVSEPVFDTRFSESEVLKVSIFMNVFNVHVNRIPTSGTVQKIQYVPGKFLAADNENAHLKNEYCAVTIKTNRDQTLTVVQIAGLIARRIVCLLEPGDAVIRGKRFGMIRFGSRLDVYLPIDAKINVHIGQKVNAGETILAHLESSA